MGSAAPLRSSRCPPGSGARRADIRSRPPPDPRSGERGSFILYVEGPRDRSILRAWAQRLLPRRAPDVLADAVIMGGRRPARARRALSRARRGLARALRARSRRGRRRRRSKADEGLEFFTWSRRHIESYLLVSGAIRRALSLPSSDHRLEAVLERELPERGRRGRLAHARREAPARGDRAARARCSAARCRSRGSRARRARTSCTRTCTRCSTGCAADSMASLLRARPALGDRARAS